jgi:DNA-binding LacI/PurR family transcriptional regulator
MMRIKILKKYAFMTNSKQELLENTHSLPKSGMNTLASKAPASKVPATKVQMDDIARLAGVSVSTVSRALSLSPLVSEKTRTRIAELAKSLKYSVNVGAQNLRRGQNRTVAVVIPYDSSSRQHVSDPFFIGMLGSIADALTLQGYDMLLSRIDADRLDLAAQYCDSGRAVGVIVIGQWGHHDQLNELASRHLPLVVWGGELPKQLYCTVGSDNVEGGSLATGHLLKTGRRRIAFFGDTQMPEVAQRFEGYERAHAALGVSMDAELNIVVPFVAEAAREAVKSLVAKKIVFDAIFACSDLLAITAIGALRDVGLSVPDDIAVVGYDDVDMASYCHPALTTIHQSIEVAGRALVDALLAIQRGDEALPNHLPTRLVVRASA